jgi:hypothetical protein
MLYDNKRRLHVTGEPISDAKRWYIMRAHFIRIGPAKPNTATNCYSKGISPNEEAKNTVITIARRIKLV